MGGEFRWWVHLVRPLLRAESGNPARVRTPSVPSLEVRLRLKTPSVCAPRLPPAQSSAVRTAPLCPRMFRPHTSPSRWKRRDLMAWGSAPVACLHTGLKEVDVLVKVFLSQQKAPVPMRRSARGSDRSSGSRAARLGHGRTWLVSPLVLGVALGQRRCLTATLEKRGVYLE